jgi:hypothetical protein
LLALSAHNVRVMSDQIPALAEQIALAGADRPA